MIRNSEERTEKMEIRHEQEHYVLYISGKFEGNYDTFTEAVVAYKKKMEETAV